MTTITKEDLKGVATVGYEPLGFVNNLYGYAPHHRPIFGRFSIQQMLEDPRICFGLELIKGPIHTSTHFFTEEESENPSVHKWVIASDIAFPYTIKSNNPEVAEFVTKSLKRFWQVGAVKALKAIEWGYSACEVIYKESEVDGRSKRIYFDNLKDFDSRDCIAITVNGGIVGCELNSRLIKNFYIGIPKVLWHVHQREQDRFYGKSRLFGAYAPWWETWTEGGARDVRRLWFYRNSFGGGNMYYPPGYTQLDGGSKISNRDLAIEMLAKLRTGGYMVFPNQDGPGGKPLWAYEPPSAAATPQGLLEYVTQLSDEELEGLGIPPEVVKSGSAGLGSATGRMIPLVAFHSSLRKTVDYLIADFSTQVLDYLIQLNFRKKYDFEVVPLVPILGYDEQAQAAQMLQGMAGQAGPQMSENAGNKPSSQEKTPATKKPTAEAKQDMKTAE